MSVQNRVQVRARSRTIKGENLVLKENLKPSSDVDQHDVQSSGSQRLSASRQLSGLIGSLPGPPQDRLGRPTSSHVRSSSSFLPMDSASLGQSIKQEERWVIRRHSPRRRRLQRFSSDDELIRWPPSRGHNIAVAEDTDNQNQKFRIPNDLDDFEVASDEEEPRSYLLGVSTPSTLRGRRLRLSLEPVPEEEITERKGSREDNVKGGPSCWERRK